RYAPTDAASRHSNNSAEDLPSSATPLTPTTLRENALESFLAARTPTLMQRRRLRGQCGPCPGLRGPRHHRVQAPHSTARPQPAATLPRPFGRICSGREDLHQQARGNSVPIGKATAIEQPQPLDVELVAAQHIPGCRGRTGERSLLVLVYRHLSRQRVREHVV